jgi:hypothetical protein
VEYQGLHGTDERIRIDSIPATRAFAAVTGCYATQPVSPRPSVVLRLKFVS